MLLSTIAALSLSVTIASAAIYPKIIKDNNFVDSITGERFLIRGVDYQPGGASAYIGRADPLSDYDTCLRDVFLFQKLGINTIRVYTVNPDLNHDQCMTLLASAGIHLILDVNSPLMGESLNRYEPWTTYTAQYLHHVFRVVHQFASYNNTLGFFAGNEIVNDELSAINSPTYIKAVIRDMKSYMRSQSPRMVPVGYSAADDLRYRVSLTKYLECGDEISAVDFYGINSYQWCGHQNFYTSAYNVLVEDYRSLSIPLFLSEYGCNSVRPRLLEEVEALYRPEMTEVFSGGLVYEFTQEPNTYGMVELDQRGNAFLIEDYYTAKSRFAKVQNASAQHIGNTVSRPECLTYYNHLQTNLPLPVTFGQEFIDIGVSTPPGRYVPLVETATTRQIFELDGTEIVDKSIDLDTSIWNVSKPEVGDGFLFHAQSLKSLPRSEQSVDGEHTRHSAAISARVRSLHERYASVAERAFVDLRVMLAALVIGAMYLQF